MTIILEKAFFLPVNSTFFFFFHFVTLSVLLQLTLPFHLPSSDDDLAFYWECWNSRGKFLCFLPPNLALYSTCVSLYFAFLWLPWVVYLHLWGWIFFISILLLLSIHKGCDPKWRTVIFTSISFFMNVLECKYIYKY